MTDALESFNYYNTVFAQNPGLASYASPGLPPVLTLNQWKQVYGFSTDPASHPDAHATYVNLRDLQIGRDMNCRQNGTDIACYVTNYGPSPAQRCWYQSDGSLICPWPQTDIALSDAISENNPFATVAMVYSPNAASNIVTFYAFDGNGGADQSGSLIPLAQLDQEGPKSIPRMCMACHGGSYDPMNHAVTGASFLPFDVSSFKQSDQPGYTSQDQEEGFRKLNALVAATTPSASILDFVDGTYPAGVNNPGSTASPSYIPSGWSGTPNLYSSVIVPYCRMCHLAQPQTFVSLANFQSYATFIQYEVNCKRDMPHAQIPFGSLLDTGLQTARVTVGFWHDPLAQTDLNAFLQSQGIDTSKCQ
jgi:hypothetical protein